MNEREFFAELASTIVDSLTPAQCDAIGDRIKSESLVSQFGFPSAVIVLQTAFDAIIAVWDYDRGDKRESEKATTKFAGPIRVLIEALALGDSAKVHAASDALARTILA